MKKAKQIVSVACALMVCTLSFTGCSAAKGSVETKTLEAEYIKLEGLVGNNGGGMLPEPAQGVGLIYQATESATSDGMASNGYSLINTGANGLSLTFTFYSDQKTTSDIILRLSDYTATGNTWTTDQIDITLNGKSINWSLATTPTMFDYNTYSDYTIASGQELTKGENKLIISMKDFEIDWGDYGIFPYFPAIDCVKLNTDATISWNPVTANTSAIAQ